MRLRSFALIVLALASIARAQYDANPGLAYAVADGKTLVLDLYLPKGATAKSPLVLWIHGGAWSGGTRQDNITNALTMLSGKGFAVATLEYRLSGVAKWPAQLQDCKGAVRWLRANAPKYNLDADHFGAWGESAGAHLAAMLGTAGGVGIYAAEGKDLDLEGTVGNYSDFSSRVQAVCDYYGPTDFLRSNTGAPFNFDVKSPTFPPALLIGGVVGEHPGLCASASPLTFVDKNDPPFLILHGTSDADVQIAQSRFLDSALSKAGVACSLQVIQGIGHGGGVFWSAGMAKTVSEFFIANLKGPTAIRAFAPATARALMREDARDAVGRALTQGKRAMVPVFVPGSGPSP